MPIEGLKEECGLFAVFGLEDAALHTALALHAQQHRGQEGAGIVTLHEGQFQTCLLYTSPSPRDKRQSRMPSSA